MGVEPRLARFEISDQLSLFLSVGSWTVTVGQCLRDTAVSWLASQRCPSATAIARRAAAMSTLYREALIFRLCLMNRMLPRALCGQSPSLNGVRDHATQLLSAPIAEIVFHDGVGLHLLRSHVDYGQPVHRLAVDRSVLPFVAVAPDIEQSRQQETAPFATAE